MKKITFKTAFNAYDDLEIIGEGGSGKVYKVNDQDGNLYALKLLDHHKANKEKHKRFKNEVFFCQRNIHKNIITILDYGFVTDENGQNPFYVMPYYSSTLRDLMSNKIPQDKVLPYFSQILDGVEAAHLKSIWHRDLKPENILYDISTDQLIVADFGIAHFTEEYLLTSVETKASDRLANFQYAAPEQRLKGQVVDYRADIFALGLILNEMFTGVVIHGTRYTKINAVASQYEYLDEIVETMVSQSPDDRPNSIDEIKKILIGKKNEFVSRQKLDELKNTVIPQSEVSDILIERPVKLINVDYQKGEFIFILNQAVNQKWVESFRNISNYHYLLGKEPSVFKFYQDRATIEGGENITEQIVTYFKEYLDKANTVYKDRLIAEQRHKEEKQKRMIQQQILEAETTQRIFKKSKYLI
ncbi:MAG: serine/threonine protein kinase [Ignavibacteriae bacterium]|nr:serine/threonine protein kinase [Ignavibacteriota bacterium]